MNLKELKNKKILISSVARNKILAEGKVLILGLGKEGIDSYKFFRKIFPKKILGLADQSEIKTLRRKTKKVKFHFGKNYLQSIKKYDVIIKTPGIPWKTIKPFLKKGKKITSQTELFFENCPGKIIGITGTKGKGTTSSLIYQVLKRGGVVGRGKVYFVGNIGKPPLQLLLKSGPEDIFVYEISSHQLINLRKSPQIAVLLNIFPAHLEYFKNFKEYLKAKENITLYQKDNDIFIYPKNVSLLIDKLARKTRAKKITFSVKNRRADCYIKNGYIFYRKEKVFKIKDSPLVGEFNLLNIMPAVIIARLFGIPAKKIANIIKKFKPLPYRLELVGNYRGIKFYNDSLATIPEAAISAIKSFGGELQTIILGGFDSNLYYKNLAREILKSKIKNLIFFPTVGEKIWKEIIQNKKQGRGVPKHFFVTDMKEAIKIALKETEKTKICLLSPAAPSFGIFRNYKERGDLFKKYTKIYGRKKTL